MGFLFPPVPPPEEDEPPVDDEPPDEDEPPLSPPLPVPPEDVGPELLAAGGGGAWWRVGALPPSCVRLLGRPVPAVAVAPDVAPSVAAGAEWLALTLAALTWSFAVDVRRLRRKE